MNQNHLSNPKQTKTQSPPPIGTASLRATALLQLICPLFRKHGERLQLANAELAEALGCSERSEWAAKTELEQMDVLFKRRYTDGPNTYWLNPRFFKDKKWYNYLKKWCDILPDFKHSLTGIGMLLSVLTPSACEPTNIKDKIPHSVYSESGSQLTKLGCECTQKGRGCMFGELEGLRPTEESDFLPRKRIEALPTEEMSKLRLIENICELLKLGGVTLDVMRDEADLYSYSYLELLAASDAISKVFGVEDLKEAFWTELKKARDKGKEVRVEEANKETEGLIDKVCEAFRKRGVTLTVDDEIDLYSFPHDAIVSACNLLKAMPDAQSPKALFWAEMRRATMAVPGRKPDFSLGEKKRTARKAARVVPVYEDWEAELTEGERQFLKEHMESVSSKSNVLGYEDYDKENAVEMRRRSKQSAFSDYIGPNKKIIVEA